MIGLNLTGPVGCWLALKKNFTRKGKRSGSKDFAAGLDFIQEMQMRANFPFISANIQTNSGNRGFNLFDKYKKLDFLLIDEPELRLGVKDRNTSIDKIIIKLGKL